MILCDYKCSGCGKVIELSPGQEGHMHYKDADYNLLRRTIVCGEFIRIYNNINMRWTWGDNR